MANRACTLAVTYCSLDRLGNGWPGLSLDTWPGNVLIVGSGACGDWGGPAGVGRSHPGSADHGGTVGHASSGWEQGEHRRSRPRRQDPTAATTSVGARRATTVTADDEDTLLDVTCSEGRSLYASSGDNDGDGGCGGWGRVEAPRRDSRIVAHRHARATRWEHRSAAVDLPVSTVRQLAALSVAHHDGPDQWVAYLDADDSLDPGELDAWWDALQSADDRTVSVATGQWVSVLGHRRTRQGPECYEASHTRGVPRYSPPPRLLAVRSGDVASGRLRWPVGYCRPRLGLGVTGGEDAAWWAQCRAAGPCVVAGAAVVYSWSPARWWSPHVGIPALVEADPCGTL